MTKMVKLSSNQLFERLRDATQTDPEGMTDQDRDQLDTQLSEFMVYVKKAQPFLKKMQADIAQYLTKKQMLINSYAGAATTLTQYEETNLTYYVDQQPDKLVVNNHESGQNLIESLKHTV